MTDTPDEALVERVNDLRARLRREEGQGFHPFAVGAARIASEAIELAALATLPAAAPADAIDEAKYADMGLDQKANAMADDCAGDPWELLGYFREKLRQSQWETDHARAAANDLAERLAALPKPAADEGYRERDNDSPR